MTILVPETWKGHTEPNHVRSVDAVTMTLLMQKSHIFINECAAVNIQEPKVILLDYFSGQNTLLMSNSSDINKADQHVFDLSF